MGHSGIFRDIPGYSRIFRDIQIAQGPHASSYLPLQRRVGRLETWGRMQVALRVGGRQGVKEKRTEDGRGGGWYGWDERGGDGWEKVRVGGVCVCVCVCVLPYSWEQDTVFHTFSHFSNFS